MSAAAKWHREQAEFAGKRESQCRRDADHSLSLSYAKVMRAEASASDAIRANHATAASALEALAVPGVADLLADLSAAALVRMYDDRDNMIDDRPSAQQRTALATLARIGRGE